ncbi:MAG TPA: polysaccharide biosynthesis tyrosine autokinase [Gemmatimonadaceae bacterium]|nr:polysaccharide biosynthesis tyrosine autokinase [Gemmatimonadaceae bacterium]
MATEFVGIREYLAIVLRHLWLVLAITAVAVGWTANTIRKTPPIYRSISTVRLVDTRQAMTGQGEGGFDKFNRMTDPIESQIQLLRSRSVAAIAVDQKGLRLIPSEKQPFVEQVSDIKVADNATADSVVLTFASGGVTAQTSRAQVSGSYGQPILIEGISFTVTAQPQVSRTVFQVVSREAAIGHVLGGINALARPKTDLLDLSFTGTEPNETRRVANAMAESFQIANASNAQQQSRRRRIFLEGQLRQTDSMLANASGAYSAYRSGRQVFSSTAKAGAQEAGLVNIDMRRAELDAERRTYQSLLAGAERAKDESSGNLEVLLASPGIASNPVVAQLYAQLTAYKKNREDFLTAGAAQSNPDVVALNGLIESTSSKLISAVRAQIQSLTARIESLDRLRASGASEIAAAPAGETQETQLAQRVQTIQKMADQLREDLQKAKMAEAVEAGQVEIVDLANTPGYQLPTGSSRKAALGLLVGLLLGVGAAVFVDGLNTSIRKRSDIERVLQIPGLAVIPRLTEITGGRKGIPRLLAKSVQRRTHENGNGRKGTPADELVTVLDIRSAGAEAYRTLRTNLIFSQAVRALRTLVITSASPGEGKTTTAANLSVSFAQQGLRVLIIDCDLRRARLHKMFGVPREPGFTDLLLGTASEEDVTAVTSVTGLYVISAGSLPPNPSELLGGDRARRALASLTEAYDLLIIDTPPLLAASDAAILATIADGAIVVLKAGETENAAAQQAVHQLTSVGARVVGAVLNDPDTKVPQYGAYYRYEYSGAGAAD